MAFHRAYHQALTTQIERVKRLHGIALVFDCHSIRSKIPRLFNGQLPDLNIGTDSGKSCSPAITDVICQVIAQDVTKDTLSRRHLLGPLTHVVNGRFRGGWITRHYGQPDRDVHAVQMELSQRRYLVHEHEPFDYDPDLAAALRALLRRILASLQTTVQSITR